jgi:hypothetical protein
VIIDYLHGDTEVFSDSREGPRAGQVSLSIATTYSLINLSKTVLLYSAAERPSGRSHLQYLRIMSSLPSSNAWETPIGNGDTEPILKIEANSRVVVESGVKVISDLPGLYAIRQASLVTRGCSILVVNLINRPVTIYVSGVPAGVTRSDPRVQELSVQEPLLPGDDILFALGVDSRERLSASETDYPPQSP